MDLDFDSIFTMGSSSTTLVERACSDYRKKKSGLSQLPTMLSTGISYALVFRIAELPVSLTVMEGLLLLFYFVNNNFQI